MRNEWSCYTAALSSKRVDNNSNSKNSFHTSMNLRTQEAKTWLMDSLNTTVFGVSWSAEGTGPTTSKQESGAAVNSAETLHSKLNQKGWTLSMQNKTKKRKKKISRDYKVDLVVPVWERKQVKKSAGGFCLIVCLAILPKNTVYTCECTWSLFRNIRIVNWPQGALLWPGVKLTSKVVSRTTSSWISGNNAMWLSLSSQLSSKITF